jgi:molybdopterin-guanine dinucleotide biosynthesis protein A
VIISTNNPEYNQFGINTVADEFPEKGPAGGLYSALKKSQNDWNLVLACDMPFLNRRFVDALLSNIENSRGVVPVHGGLIEPLAAVYHKSLEAALADAIKDSHLSMHQIIKSARINFLPMEYLLTEFPFMFENLNNPLDMKDAPNAGL